MKAKILLLEDDPNLAFVLQEHLELNGFAVALKINGDEGLRAVRGARYDLCLVDVMMPKKDGFSFAREFRSFDPTTPIIFLTARSLKEDRIEGFKAGADDYVTKPFSMEELLLRIQAVLRRSSAKEKNEITEEELHIGRYLFRPRNRLLQYGKRTSTLTDKESQILMILCQAKNRLTSRRDILLRVWNDDSYFNGRSLDVYITKLRKYLGKDSSVKILTVHGKGYSLIA